MASSLGDTPFTCFPTKAADVVHLEFRWDLYKCRSLMGFIDNCKAFNEGGDLGETNYELGYRTGSVTCWHENTNYGTELT